MRVRDSRRWSGTNPLGTDRPALCIGYTGGRRKKTSWRTSRHRGEVPSMDVGEVPSSMGVGAVPSDVKDVDPQ